MSSEVINPNFQANKPCFPGCMEWRPVKNVGPAIQKANTAKTYGLILPTQSVTIRKIFSGLFFIQIPLTLIRIPMRIGGLCMGDFIESGRKLAHKKWHMQGQIWYLDRTNKKPGNLTLLVVRYVLQELVKNIAKIVLYPIAAVGMMLASIYGAVFNPWDARDFYGDIERTFARELPEPSKRGFAFKIAYRLSDYFAICMQPDPIWEDNHFMLTLRNTSSQTIRASLRTLSATLREHQECLKNEGFMSAEALDFLHYLKVNAYRFSESEKNEWDGKNLTQTPSQQDLCQILSKIQNSILKFVDERNREVANEIYPQTPPSEESTAFQDARCDLKRDWNQLKGKVFCAALDLIKKLNGKDEFFLPSDRVFMQLTRELDEVFPGF